MKMQSIAFVALSALSLNLYAAAPAWFDSAVDAEFATMVKNRQTLHKMPELGNQEYKTQEFIIKYLKSVGVDKVIKGYKSSPTAVIGIINPGKGNVIGLRSDIDGLPIHENTGLPFASKNKGKMWGKDTYTAHMCGHDGHMTMLLTAAKILAQHKNEVPREVVLVFQPAEEGNSLENPMVVDKPKNSGAKALVEDGLIEDFKIQHMFGMHVDASGKSGRLELVSGGAMNSGDSFEIHLTGKQAHGGMPWMSRDATLMTAETVMSLQQIVSRNVNPGKGVGILSVGKMSAGETVNVISGKGYILGTVRTNNSEIQSTILKRIPEVADGIAKAYGGSAKTRIISAYPVLYNDPKLAVRTIETLKGFGVDIVSSTRNPGASEDFAYYAQKVPSSFMILSVATPGAKPTFPHSDRFMIYDEALKTGVKAHIGAALGDYKGL